MDKSSGSHGSIESTVLTLSELYPEGTFSMTECIAADLLMREPHATAATILQRSLGVGVTARIPFRDPGESASPMDRQTALVRYLDHLLSARHINA